MADRTATTKNESLSNYSYFITQEFQSDINYSEAAYVQKLSHKKLKESAETEEYL
ncbi:MAG: hypothetical protein HQK61_04120 [Desulfamplus sp.]|nr:hypothetical protein [Desulfamplus sp.]